MRKKPRGREMGHWAKKWNKAISNRRHVIERVLGTIKRVYGFHRARYVGLEKVMVEVSLKACAYNLKGACNLSQVSLEKGKFIPLMR